MNARKKKKSGLNLLLRISAVTLLTAVVAGVWLLWPVVGFLYRERTLAESVRQYAQTSGILKTADDDMRSYLVKLARHHKLQLSEGDVEIDYQDSPEAFGVPTRIGYTLSAKVDFHGLRSLPLLAQRSFVIAAQRSE